MDVHIYENVKQISLNQITLCRDMIHVSSVYTAQSIIGVGQDLQYDLERKKSYLWNLLTERDLLYIFVNVHI